VTLRATARGAFPQPNAIGKAWMAGFFVHGQDRRSLSVEFYAVRSYNTRCTIRGR